jgi:hypothetical protein
MLSSTRPRRAPTLLSAILAYTCTRASGSP